MRRKKKIHLSLSGLVAGWGVYRELWSEIPGTGLSVMDLVHSGWSRTEIARYFPLTTLNLVLLAVAISTAIYIFSKENSSHA